MKEKNVNNVKMAGFKPHVGRKSQKERFEFKSRVNKKKGQEEMVGFALIVIIIAVILIVILSIAIRGDKNREAIESYKVDSFVNSILQYTTNCENNFGKILVQDLIFSCLNNEICTNLENENSCSILNFTINEILEKSYKVGPNRFEKGFFFNISVDGESLLNFSAGNVTKNEKGAREGLQKRGKTVEVAFRVYS